jgi:hypothetical protein
VAIGIFREKQLVRMADTKLVSEICDAALYGIRTTNKAMLDRLYKTRDKKFAEEQDIQSRITDALDELRLWTDIHGTNLVKPYIVYSLLLAMMHVKKPIRELEAVFKSPRTARFDQRMAVENLLAISTALEDPENNEDFAQFVGACTEKTNTREQRTIRFVWLCRAITSPDFP